MQLGELLAGDRAWRVGERAGGLLGFGEGDHVADGAGSGEQHHQAVEAEGNAAVRGRAEFKSAEQEAELLLRLFFSNAEQIEHLGLHVRGVNADGAAADFAAVEDKIISPAADFERLGFEQSKVFVKRRSEGMMHRSVAFALAVELDQREISNPEEIIDIAVHQAKPSAQLKAQLGEHLIDHRRAVCAEENQIARLGVESLAHRLDLVFIEKLGDRRLPLVFLDLDPGHAFGPEAACVIRQIIQVLARERAAALGVDRLDNAAALDDRIEDLEAAAAQFLGQINQLQTETGVRLVVAVARDGLLIAHARERRVQRNAASCRENLLDQALGNSHDVVLADKTQLKVYLGEFRLAVGAQVFIAETFDNLEIPVHAAHHQQLLEKLRRLRQSEEFARINPARHEIIPRPFRRGARQHRRFDFEKAAVAEEAPRSLRRRVPHDEVGSDFGPPQVKIAVLQADVVRNLAVLVEREGRGFARVKDAQLADHDLNRPGLQLRVLHVAGPRLNLAAHRQNPLRAQLVRLGVRFGVDFRVEDNLGDAPAVAEVDEDNPAVVAAAKNPTHENDLLIQVIEAESVAVMCAPQRAE